MINDRGELVTAYVDSCDNYNPDKSKPTTVKSAISGTIFECHNFVIPDGSLESCGSCKNYTGRDK